MFMDKKQVIITTSWDDGYALDIRIAELLEKYKIKGTFYIPIRNSERQVMEPNILTEISRKHEIGGHTVNHIYLNTLGLEDAKYEISTCKTILQDKLGKNIDAFCYPGGKYSLRDIQLVQDAGFLFGRTTKMLYTSLESSPNIMNTSIQVYNHSSAVLIRHCLKNLFLLPIVQNYFFYKGNKNFSGLIEGIMNRLLENGGVFHLWGHSWEIEKYDLWKEFEMVLKVLASNKEISYLNNTECWNVSNKIKSES
jgi:peptidoglycan-N-acetylglucosamine deacetylase